MSRREQWKRLAFGLAATVPLALLPAFTRLSGKRAQDCAPALRGHRAPLQALAFGPDGATLTSAAYQLGGPPVEVEVTDWDTRTGHPTSQRHEPLGALRALVFVPGGRTLAAALEDRSVWHDRRRLCEHLPQVCALAVAPDAGTLATSTLDCTIQLWDASTGEQRSTFPGHPGIGTMAFSPDGLTLASGGYDGIVKLWDVGAGTERAVLRPSTEEVSAVTFAPDGSSLALAFGCTVQIWDVNARRRLADLEGHEGKVKCLAYSPDGTRLASGGYDRTVRLWDVPR
jgi:WD40 repeat protein